MLALLVAINSGAGLYCKTESDQFYARNQQQYSVASKKIDKIIQEFYFAYLKAGFDDLNINEKKDEFLSLSSKTFNDIYTVKFDLVTDYPLLPAINILDNP